ncbi:MAG: AsnC family transcriptional regulator [Nanoarchaeota archaeon]|nr:AsnC family transcriptional regulator [Nanoarchaeota archaeon]
MTYFKVKLDKTDRKILAELDKNCRIPLTTLAKRVRKSRQAVEYRINQLIKKNIILSFNTAINPYKLGYKVYKTYFQLKNIPEEKEKLLEFLKTCGRVYWFGECDGEWNLIFGVFARSDYEFYDLKNELFAKFGKIIIKHRGTILLDAQQFPKMYFTDQISKPVLFGGKLESFELKEIDKKILFNTVNQARISIINVAKKVGSTPIIVRNRLKKLEKVGVIIQHRTSINLEKLGIEFFKAIVHLEKQDKLSEKKLLLYVSQLSNIQYFIRNLWDIELELIVSDYIEYNQIINKIKKEFPEMIRNVETVIMKSDVWIPAFII